MRREFRLACTVNKSGKNEKILKYCTRCCVYEEGGLPFPRTLFSYYFARS